MSRPKQPLSLLDLSETFGLQLFADERFLGGREIWPSGLVLSTAIQQGIVDVADKRILEIGAGLGLPSFVAELKGALQVHVSDRPELCDIFTLNKKHLQSRAEFVSVDWLELERDQCKLPVDLDLILGADIVYFEEQDALIGLLDKLLLPYPQRIFVLAYRERTALDRNFLNQSLVGRYHCFRQLKDNTENVELYWFRARPSDHCDSLPRDI